MASDIDETRYNLLRRTTYACPATGIIHETSLYKHSFSGYLLLEQVAADKDKEERDTVELDDMTLIELWPYLQAKRDDLMKRGMT
jgi:hypothetical protein